MSAVVRGVLSPAGALNHPDASFCRSTGVRLGANRTRHLVAGARPALAVVIVDDGVSVAISDSVTFGASPDNDIVLSSSRGSVSRWHFALDVDGWTVRACDLGSTNGTFHSSVGSHDWVRLTPHDHLRVASGDRFGLGDRIVRIRLLA